MFSLRDRSANAKKKKKKLAAFNIDENYIGECWKCTLEGCFNEEMTNLTKSY